MYNCFSELIGVGPELTRYYRLRAASFIQENPGSSVGQPGKWQVQIACTVCTDCTI